MNKLTNIFWTGGFDSTFRLLQLIEDSKCESINLFYIALEIDNINSDIKRHSIDIELKTMSLILRNIETSKIKKFFIIGDSQKLLLCNLIFEYSFMNYIQKEKITYSDKTKSLYQTLFENELVLRPVSQWGAITEILDEINITAEICIEKGGGFWERMNKYLRDGKLEIREDLGLNAFEKYILPIIDLDRDAMKSESIKKNWSDILDLTWSCWYPTELGYPCGRCFTCIRRPNLFN